MTNNGLIILILNGIVVFSIIIMYILMFIGNKNFYVVYIRKNLANCHLTPYYFINHHHFF